MSRTPGRIFWIGGREFADALSRQNRHRPPILSCAFWGPACCHRPRLTLRRDGNAVRGNTFLNEPSEDGLGAFLGETGNTIGIESGIVDVTLHDGR